MVSRNYLERISMLPIWEIEDEIDRIESYIKETHTKKRFVCYQLERFEEKTGKKEYMVIGAGKDGNAFIRLLNLMGKSVIRWCDNSTEKVGSVLYGHTIVSVEDALKDYAGEIILIATRKYEMEILEQVLKNRPELRNSIFDYDELYARGMWKRENNKKAVLSYPPMWITIGVTSACPNKCLFCSYHGEAAKEISNTYGLQYMLSYKNFCKMIDMAKEGGVPRIHICGTGEPFINPEILNMIDYTIEKYGSVSLQTDFWSELYQKKNYLDELIKREKYITYIATDILSCNEDEHDKIKQGMKYHELLNTLDYLGENSNIRILGVNILTRQNYKNLKGIIDDLLLRNVNFELMVTNLLSYDYSKFTSSNNVYQIGDREITDELREVEKYAKKKGIKIVLPNPAHYGEDCWVFWKTFQTWPVKGCVKERFAENMIPHACAAVVRGQLNSLGYLFDFDNIMDAWNNEKLVKIRENLINSKYPDKWCKRCFMYYGKDSYYKE